MNLLHILRGTSSLAIWAAFILSMSLTLPHIAAQNSGPSEGMGGMAFAYIPNPGSLFLQGGPSAFFELDLSKGWPANTPVWKPASKNVPETAVFPHESKIGGVTAENQFFVVSGGTLFVYGDFTSGWTTKAINPTTSPAPSASSSQQVVTSRGTVFFLGDGLRWQPEVGAADVTFQSIGGEKVQAGHSALALANGTLLSTVPNATVIGFQTMTQDAALSTSAKWVEMPRKGKHPTIRTKYCLVRDADNDRIYLFGGQDKATVLKELWSFDIKTETWAKLPDALDALVARTNMACAIHNKQLIIWGGFTDINGVSPTNKDPLIFKLNYNVWADKYEAPLHPPTPTNLPEPTNPVPPGPIPTPIPPKKINLGLILGSVAGGLALVGLIAFLVFKRNNARRQGPTSSPLMDHEDDGKQNSTTSTQRDTDSFHRHPPLPDLSSVATWGQPIESSPPSGGGNQESGNVPKERNVPQSPKNSDHIPLEPILDRFSANSHPRTVVSVESENVRGDKEELEDEDEDEDMELEYLSVEHEK